MVKKGFRIGDKTHKVEVWGKPPRKAKPGKGLLPPTPKPPIQTNKRQNSWTPPRRSNKCFRCGIEGHYIAQCPLLRQDSCDRCSSRGHTSRDCVPIQRGHTHARTGRTGRQWRQSGNKPQLQSQSKTQQVEQPQQTPQQQAEEEKSITQPTGGEWNKDGLEWVATGPAPLESDWPRVENSASSIWQDISRWPTRMYAKGVTTRTHSCSGVGRGR